MMTGDFASIWRSDTLYDGVVSGWTFSFVFSFLVFSCLYFLYFFLFKPPKYWVPKNIKYFSLVIEVEIKGLDELSVCWVHPPQHPKFNFNLPEWNENNDDGN